MGRSGLVAKRLRFVNRNSHSPHTISAYLSSCYGHPALSNRSYDRNALVPLSGPDLCPHRLT